MTGLYPLVPQDGIAGLIAWIAGIGNADPTVGNIGLDNVGPDRLPGMPLPYFMVYRPVTTDDKITQYGVYVVQTFATAPTPRQAQKRAHDAAMLVHRRILAMGPPFAPQQKITIPSGKVVQCDGVAPKSGPDPVRDYSEDRSIQSYAAEYDIPWRYQAA